MTILTALHPPLKKLASATNHGMMSNLGVTVDDLVSGVVVSSSRCCLKKIWYYISIHIYCCPLRLSKWVYKPHWFTLLVV